MAEIEVNSEYREYCEGLVKCTDRQYFADNGLNSSSLKLILDKSPFHYMKLKQFEETSEALRVGTLVHAKILGTSETFTVWDGASFNSKAYREFLEENPDGYHVLQKEMDLADKIVEKARKYNNNIDLMLEEAEHYELGVFCNVAGIRGKGKIDAIRLSGERIKMWDIKTTSNIFDFQYSARKYRYHLQAAWYTKLVSKVCDKPVDFELIVIEKSYPFTVVNWGFSDRVLEDGVKQMSRAFGQYMNGIANNYWPALPENNVLDWRV